MTREHLPERRSAEVITFDHGGRRWTASCARFDDGRLAEILIDATKESPLASATCETAIIVSLALQFGCPVDTLRHALGGRDASPIGAALALVSNE
jgi:hypothetical protein